MRTYSIAVLPGDGIGPEVIGQAVRVLQSVGTRYGHTFNLQHALVGIAAIEAEGDAISDATMQLCQQSDAILFDAIGGLPPLVWPNSKARPDRPLLRLRKYRALFANF